MAEILKFSKRNRNKNNTGEKECSVLIYSEDAMLLNLIFIKNEDDELGQKVMGILSTVGKFKNNEPKEIKLCEDNIDEIIDIIETEIMGNDTYTDNIKKGASYLIARLKVGKMNP